MELLCTFSFIFIIRAPWTMEFTPALEELLFVNRNSNITIYSVTSKSLVYKTLSKSSKMYRAPSFVRLWVLSNHPPLTTIFWLYGIELHWFLFKNVKKWANIINRVWRNNSADIMSKTYMHCVFLLEWVLAHFIQTRHNPHKTHLNSLGLSFRITSGFVIINPQLSE